MIDIKFLRENPEVVKENIRKKYQDEKLPLVDEVIALAVGMTNKHPATAIATTHIRLLSPAHGR